MITKSAPIDLINTPRSLTDLALIFYCPVDQFWFLYALFVLVVTAASLLRLGIGPWGIFAIAILVYPHFLVSSYGWAVLSDAAAYAVYLALGLIVGERINGASQIHSSQLRAIVLAGLFVSSLGGIFGGGAIIFAFSGIAATVALAILLSRYERNITLNFLGRYSLEIYVAHTMASAGVRILLLHLHVTAVLPQIVLGTLAGLLFPVGLAITLEKTNFRYGFTLPKTAVSDSLAQHA